MCRQTGGVNFNSESLVIRDALRWVNGLSETIKLSVWRPLLESWDWDVKENQRGCTAKLLTNAYVLARLFERASDTGERSVRLTTPLGRGEGFHSTLKCWNDIHVFKHAMHDCTAAGLVHLPATIQKKVAQGEFDGTDFLDRCNATIVCDATSLCPKICISGSSTEVKAPHPR